MSRFGRLPIARQVLFTFGLISLFLAVNGGLIFSSLRTIEHRSSELRTRILVQWKTANDLAGNMESMQADVLRHVLITDSEGMKAQDRIILQIRETNTRKLAEYEKLVDDERERRLLTRAVHARREYLRLTDSLLVLSRANDDTEKVRFAVSVQAPAYDTYHRAIGALAGFSEQKAHDSVAASTQLITRTGIIANVLLGVAILIIAGTGFTVASVARRLRQDNQVLRDEIAERVRSEDGRQATEARYHTLFECAPDGIVIADPKSYYLDANASICRMLGYTRGELIGMHASDIVSQAEIQHIEPALNTINADAAYYREWQFQRKDSSTFDADVIVTRLPRRQPAGNDPRCH
jgi:PAS domain S-box-containing protein